MSEKKQDITHLRQRLAHSNIIVDATRRFTSTLDSDEIQLALFEAVFQITGAQQIALHLTTEKGLQSYICHPMEGLRTETAVLPPEATAFRICEEVKQVIWQHDDGDQAAPPISVEAIKQFDSYLALPLKGADKIVGVIEAFNLLEPQNAAQQAALLTEIAGPASLAIYNEMLYREAQHEIAERKRIELEVRQKEMKLARRAAQLETVSRVSAYTSTILESDKLLQEVVDLTKDQFELYHVHIYLVNATGERLDLAAGAGDIGRQMVAQGRSVPLQQKQSLVAQVARSGHGLIENDVLNNPAFLPHPLLPDTRAETAVPMILGGRVIGVLDVQSDHVDAFIEQDIHIQTTLASHVAVALENAWSYEHARTSLAETEALLDITKETSRLLELANITDNVLDKVLAATNFDAGLITVVDSDTQSLKISSHRLPEQFLQMLAENGLDGTLCDLVYRRQESIIVTDMAVDAPMDVTGLMSMGFRSYQGVLLESKGQVLGTLCIFSRQRLDPEKANSVFLQAIGQQVGIAIRNAVLIEQTQTALSEAQESRQSVQEYLDMQRVLHELNIELFGIDDLDELYRRAVELAHTRLGFERIGMYLLNEPKDVLLGTYGIDIEGNLCNEQAPEYYIDQKETIDTFILNRARLVVDEDIDLWYSGEVVGRGWHISAAMWVEDSPIGVIFADNLLTGQPLEPYHSELLFAYAGIVSNLIQRNRFEAIITKRAAEMQAVAEVGMAAATILDTDELLQEVVDLTKNDFDLYHAHIYLLDKETETLVLTSGAGAVGQQMVAEGRRIPLQQEQSLVARAARSRQGVIINDVQSEPGFLPHPLLPDTRAEMAIPLITGEQVLGVLDVQSNRLNHFTREDISTFTTLATQTAVALQNARSFEQAQMAFRNAEQSEKFLISLINTIPNPIFYKDTDGVYRGMNQAFLEMLGVQSDDLLGKSVFDLQTDKALAQKYHEMDVALFENPSAPQIYESQLTDAAGQTRDVIFNKNGFYQADGSLGGLVGVILDITERKKSEKVLQERETLLRTIIDSTPDWIFIKDQEHRYRVVNQGYADALHIAPEDFIGKNDLELGFPEELVKGNPEKGIRGFWADDRLVIDSGQMQVYPDDPATIDGVVHTFHTIKTPLRELDGQVWGVLAFARDITERKSIEEALAKQARELQIVAELSTTVATTLEQEKLLQEVVDLTRERFDFYHSQIYLLNTQQDTLVLAFGAGDVGRKLVAQKHQISLSAPQSLVVRAARSGQAVVVNDVRENPDWLPNELLPQTQAEMAVPMMVGDRVVGVLDVQSESVNRFTDQDVQIQTTLAAQVSIALENARSFEQAQTAVAEMNALTRRLTREGWQDYLDQRASEGLGYIFDSSGSNVLKPLSEATSEAIVWMEDGNGSQPAKPFFQPIAIHGETIGQLAVMPEDGEDEVDSEIAEIIRSVIEQLGARIENLRLTDQTQMALAETEEQAQRLAWLNEMGAALNQATSLTEVYNVAVAETSKVLAVDRASLALLSEAGDHFEITAVWGDEVNLPVGTRLPIEEAPMLSAVQENRIVYGAIEGAVESALYVPLVMGDKVIGTLNVGRKEAKTIKASDENLLRQVAALVSSNIENMRFLTNEQARAQREQMLRQITQRIRSSADVETIMRTAVQEIGRTLGRKTYIYLGDDREA